MNRLLTSMVQIFIASAALYMAYLMWGELKQDVREFIKEFKK